ncbi:hypothetical protein UVI_02035030 [Ustilaginoidea virens]|nr:hypothetical protein UVI_02035030 [Ustilaginoidea virens]
MSETNETSQSVETDFPSLLAHPAKQEASDANDPGPGPGYSCFPLQKCKPVVEDTDDACALSDQMDEFLSLPGSSMLGHGIKDLNGQLFTETVDTQSNLQQHLEASLAADSDMKSLEGHDIASRRNRRPAPLSIAGGRSKSYTARSSDMLRRGDQESCMRRVSSSSGSGRVMKSVASPRSPLHERSVDALLQRRRPSPTASGRHGSAAPPTPDTPVALQQQELVGPSVSALYPLNGKYTPPNLVIPDPTLRTPPTTPGFSDGLFHLGAGYDMAIPEETLVASGLDRMHDSVCMGAHSASFGNYVANAQCSNQQLGPIYSAQTGQTYFHFMGADDSPDYTWSEMSPSTASTASSTQQQYMSLHQIDS